MDSKIIFDKLKFVEKNLILKNFKVNDIDMWPFIRFQFVERLNQLVLEKRSANKPYIERLKRKIQLLNKAIYLIVKSILSGLKSKKNKKKTTYDFLFLTDVSAKRIKVNGKWYDTFVDPIIDYYKRKNVTFKIFETNRNFSIKGDNYRKSESIQLSVLIIFIKSLFMTDKIQFSNSFRKEHRKYKNLLAEISCESAELTLSEIKFEVSYIYQLTKLFSYILSTQRPKKVLLIPYNSYCGRALTYVSKQCKLETIDIQHGIQGPYHAAYSQFNNVPIESFNTVPDTFFTWEETDTKNIINWTKKVKSIEVSAIGNLYREQFLKNTGISVEFDKEFDNYYRIYEDRIFILFSLIWGENKIPDDFLRIIEEFNNKYFFLIRNHPNSSQVECELVKNSLKNLKTKNFDIDKASDFPLYTILKNVKLNITQRSSVVLDAVSMGMPSIVTDKIGLKYYEEQILSGKVLYCKNFNEIKNCINLSDLASSQPSLNNIIKNPLKKHALERLL